MLTETVARVKNKAAFQELRILAVESTEVWVAEPEVEDQYTDACWPRVYVLHVPTRLQAFTHHWETFPSLGTLLQSADEQNVTWLIIQEGNE